MDNTLEILASAGDAVCAINYEQRVVFWNEAAETTLGIKNEEAIGQSCWQIFQGKTTANKQFCGPDCPILARIKAGESVSHIDLWIRNPAGERTMANFSTFAIPKQNEDPTKEALIVHLLRRIPKINVPPYRLRINLLGPLEVWQSDGTLINGKYWRRAKVRRLFVFLALKRGQLVPRDELIGTLWPNKDYATGLRNLNTTVYNLRRCLEPNLEHGTDSHYLFYESDHYWLGGGQPHWIDLDAFKLGIQQARLVTAVDDAIHHYQEALSLYRGDYLVDLSTAHNTNQRNEQQQVRDLYLEAMEELGTRYQHQEQTEKARTTYLKILAVNPNRESTCNLLSRLSQETETWTDSIAYCQRLAASLKDELDLILSQDLGNRRNQGKKDD